MNSQVSRWTAYCAGQTIYWVHMYREMQSIPLQLPSSPHSSMPRGEGFDQRRSGDKSRTFSLRLSSDCTQVDDFQQVLLLLGDRKWQFPCRPEVQVSALETLGLSPPLQNCSTALLFRSSLNLQERENEFPRGQPTWWVPHRQVFFFCNRIFLGTRTATLHQPCRHHFQGIHSWI